MYRFSDIFVFLLNIIIINLPRISYSMAIYIVWYGLRSKKNIRQRKISWFCHCSLYALKAALSDRRCMCFVLLSFRNVIAVIDVITVYPYYHWGTIHMGRVDALTPQNRNVCRFFHVVFVRMQCYIKCGHKHLFSQNINISPFLSFIY